MGQISIKEYMQFGLSLWQNWLWALKLTLHPGELSTLELLLLAIITFKWFPTLDSVLEGQWVKEKVSALQLKTDGNKQGRLQSKVESCKKSQTLDGVKIL